jgi:uncharacterized protein
VTDGVPSGGTSLDPRMVAVWRVRAALAAAAVTVAALVTEAAARAAGADLPAPGAATGALSAASAAAAWWWPAVRYRHWRYDAGARALELHHGVLFRTASVIPYFRVQHVDVNQGPVERALGVCRLVIRTASATTDAELPGIAADRAAALREVVLDRAGGGDAV